MGWFVLASLLDFNSRPHGGRLPHPAPLPGASGFQLTPSRRATIFSIDILLILVYFNSRPHGGRRGEHHSDCAHENYFNSRPHGGRPFSCIMYSVTENISTHALTEGDATKVLFRSLYAFQLTPSRRATIFRMTMREHTGNFNSRPHGGRRKEHFCFRCRAAFQLTPSRRATRYPVPDHSAGIFQLTPSRRATANLDKFFF